MNTLMKLRSPVQPASEIADANDWEGVVERYRASLRHEGPAPTPFEISDAVLEMGTKGQNPKQIGFAFREGLCRFTPQSLKQWVYTMKKLRRVTPEARKHLASLRVVFPDSWLLQVARTEPDSQVGLIDRLAKQLKARQRRAAFRILRGLKAMKKESELLQGLLQDPAVPYSVDQVRSLFKEVSSSLEECGKKIRA